MKKFKWIIALVAVLAVPVSVGAVAPVASAANCYARDYPMFWNGVLNYRANLYNCSGVDYVQFGWPGNHYHGWIDYTWGGEVQAYDSYGGGVTAQQGGAANDNYWYYSYCGGGVHSISAHYSYRIHNYANGGSWGPWHDWIGPQYIIRC